MTETISTPPPAKIPIGPRFIANREELLSAVEAAAAIVKARTPKAILTCAMIEVDGSSIIVKATNLEISLRSEVRQVQIESVGGGKTAASAELLRNVLSQSTADNVTIDASGAAIKVTDDNSTSRLNLYNAEEFPSIGRDFDADATVTMPLAALVQTLTRAMLFSNREASSGYSTGVLMLVEKGRINIVATDGRRMFWDWGNIKNEGVASAIIPPGAVARICKMAGEDITIKIGSNQATFEVDGMVLATNLFEGQFPPYKDAILPDPPRSFTVGREHLAACVRKATAFVNETSKGARFVFTLNGLTITTQSAELGSAQVNVPGKLTGTDVEVGINPKFMLDCLTSTAEEVTMEITAPNRPFVVKDGTNSVCVVMPINLQ